jgi:hypothetical protein
MSSKARSFQASSPNKPVLSLVAGAALLACGERPSLAAGAEADGPAFDPYVFVQFGPLQVQVNSRGEVSYSLQNPGFAGVGITYTPGSGAGQPGPGLRLPWPPVNALWISPTHSLECRDGTFVFDRVHRVALLRAYDDLLVFLHPEGFCFAVHRNGAYAYQESPAWPVQVGYAGAWHLLASPVILGSPATDAPAARVERPAPRVSRPPLELAGLRLRISLDGRRQGEYAFLDDGRIEFTKLDGSVEHRLRYEQDGGRLTIYTATGSPCRGTVSDKGFTVRIPYYNRTLVLTGAP